uniref:ATP synthase complex subunit 8 n=1 Tax=Homatula variegata TaxID=297507 RepID=K9M0S3_HOMVA|nr:ATP synthase F0 subunit 8 [Homatula variegata]YP_009745329.1 ATP synthase F0 subunit 8 [Homatula laxiclathra]AFQ31601.1 ATP synthase F0 subunit 8 [Homatula variegata]QIH29775.1 ATP synthase F0 subunit 8 [Homatula laxiclathra]
MPQLNPAPWFAILVFSWLMFLTIIPTKVMSHVLPNEPAHLDSEKHKTESWDWPWQ